MKNKKIPGSFLFSELWGAPAFVMLAALFVCGAIAGCFTGQMAAGSGLAPIERLADMLETEARQTPGAREALLAALGAFGWQMAALAAGWLRPASLFLSLLTLVRGFSLSFSASALLHAFGTEGIWLSLASGGVTAVITVPCLLVTAAACFLAAQDAPRGRRGGYFYALGRYRGAIFCCTVAAMWAGALRLPFAWMIERWVL